MQVQVKKQRVYQKDNEGLKPPHSTGERGFSGEWDAVVMELNLWVWLLRFIIM